MEGGSMGGPGASLSLALRALEEGHIDQAIQLLQFAVVTAPDNEEAHFALGRAHLARENLPLAIASLRRAVQLDPRHLPARCALGRSLLREHQPEAARQVIEEALALDPECREAREILDMLPRPEDHLLLADLDSAGLLPAASAAAVHRPTRLLLVVGLMMGALVILLSVMMLWMRTLSSSGASSTASAPASEASALPPSPATYTLPGPSAPSLPTNASASANASAPAVDPRRAAAEALRRVLIAQRSCRERSGRYASLAELEKLGVLDPGAAEGRPLPLYGNAVLHEEPPTLLTFRITASLPDGTTLVVDQTDRPPEQ